MLRDHEAEAVVGPPDVVDRNDVGMVQSGEDPGLGEVSFDVLGAGDSLRPGHLDGDPAVQLGIPRQINPPEASLAEPLDHRVAVNGGRVGAGCLARRARTERPVLQRRGRVIVHSRARDRV